MTQVIDYTIDGEKVSLDVSGSPEYVYGVHEFLSTADTDITFGSDWYSDGFKTMPFLTDEEFALVRNEISNVIEKFIASLGVDTTGFEIGKYHRFVTDDEMHLKVVGRTRDLFPEDFSLSMRDLVEKIEGLTGFKLTDIDPLSGERLHIIVRINRPRSTDYNPPHKDSYEDTSRHFLNVWVPICGVNERSSLPLAPGSHLLPEDKILRTLEGGVVAGKKYRVRSVAAWDGRSDLYRARVNEGELLIFSCHLIHGIAFNDQDDQTRVSLEFRLCRDDRA
ncbi:MAG TPA: phytanoyl-CoA dioxygenase family protein [Allosphingosinicella sp.]